jgi:histidyl-tRNA synthetase
LRSEWNNVEIYATGKLKKRMARANEAGALVAVLIGEDELAAGEVTVRDLHGGEQARVAPGDVGEIVSKAQNAQWLRLAEADGIAIPNPDAE